MKKITLLLLLLSLSSCLKNTQIDYSQDHQLSSPNQPIYTINLCNSEPWSRFCLVSEDSFGRRNYWGTVWSDDQGNVIQEQEGIWQNLTIACRDFGPGEFIDIWLVNPRGGEGLRAHIVPFPLLITQHGYTIYLEKDDKLAQNWRMIGTGFEPGEYVEVITYSGNTIYTTDMYANCQGEISGDVEAWVEGKSTGETRMEFHTQFGELIFNFPWGDSWFAWKKKFVEENQKRDCEFRRDLIWTSNYR